MAIDNANAVAMSLTHSQIDTAIPIALTSRTTGHRPDRDGPRGRKASACAQSAAPWRRVGLGTGNRIDLDQAPVGGRPSLMSASGPVADIAGPVTACPLVGHFSEANVSGACISFGGKPIQ